MLCPQQTRVLCLIPFQGCSSTNLTHTDQHNGSSPGVETEMLNCHEPWNTNSRHSKVLQQQGFTKVTYDDDAWNPAQLSAVGYLQQPAGLSMTETQPLVCVSCPVRCRLDRYTPTWFQSVNLHTDGSQLHCCTHTSHTSQPCDTQCDGCCLVHTT